jgi:hypothetical protein
MLRARGVRLVQVARPALATNGGKPYVVLDDTAAPRRLVRAGPVRLSDELARNGTIAQVSNRRCSLRWKGEILDAWIADHIPPGYTHVLGYGADEQRRIDRDSAITRHGRQPLYPLQEWGWTRTTSSLFLRDTTRTTFRRSCCSHRPFQTSRASMGEWASRWAAYPKAGALALRLEHTALALNPRMSLFGARAAWDLANEHQLTDALSMARRQVAAARWALYDVRRTFTGPTTAIRSVRILGEGTRGRMQSALARHPDADPRRDRHGIHRAWLRPAGTGYPRVEHLVVAAPVGVATKQRASFERVWHDLTADGGDAPMCGPGTG